MVVTFRVEYVFVYDRGYGVGVARGKCHTLGWGGDGLAGCGPVPAWGWIPDYSGMTDGEGMLGGLGGEIR